MASNRSTQQLSSPTSRDRYRFLFENSADPILIIEGGRFTECNLAAVQMLGFDDKSEVLDLHPSEISPQYQPDGQLSIEKSEGILARLENEPYQRFEWTHVRADGTEFPVEVSLIALPLEDGVLIHTTWRDIAARKQLEKEHRHFQKMDAIGKLAGGIAHDFNNNLVPIIGYAEMLADHITGDSRALQWAQEIHRAASISAMLVGKLLAISRKDLGEQLVVEIVETVGTHIDMLSKLSGEDIAIEFEPPRDKLKVLVGAGDIEQILLNLAANARDAMPKGGVITISAEKQARPEGEFATVSFTDNGTGMADDVVARAFEPFFTTKELGAGTGLGLSTVFGLVTEAQGDISIRSAPGEGTTVTFSLPLLSEERLARREVSEHPVFRPTPTANRGHVLLIEDNPQVAEFTKLMLETEGYCVSQTDDPTCATDLAIHERPDMIISDVIMPDLSGPEVVKQIRAAGIDAPVVFMSGYTEDRLATQDLDLEDAPLLRKPFSRAQLLDIVSGMLGYERR